MRTWRDVDSTKPCLGIRLWRVGFEIHWGRRVYRGIWL